MNAEIKDKAYRIYVTDVLRLMCENTAKMTQGSYFTTRYKDLVSFDEPKEIEDSRTGDEILDDIFDQLGIGGDEE